MIGDYVYYLLTGMEYTKAKDKIQKTQRLWRGPYEVLKINNGRVGIRNPECGNVQWKPLSNVRKAWRFRDRNGEFIFGEEHKPK